MLLCRPRQALPDLRREELLMIWKLADYVFLGVAAIPFIYYAIALYSAWRYFHSSASPNPADLDCTRPISILKPIRGLDPDAYETVSYTHLTLPTTPYV